MRAITILAGLGLAGCGTSAASTNPSTDERRPMYLRDVESFDAPPPYGPIFQRMRDQGAPIPQILHLFAFKKDRTKHLQLYTHEVMRGPSPLTPAQRELIAALTSHRNRCVF